jgi:hypothetical protein
VSFKRKSLQSNGMRVPFDIQKFTSKHAAVRDPKSPLPEPQEHAVTLQAPTSEAEQWDRWDGAQAWCREHVAHGQGQRWSRRRKRDGSLVFTFSDYPTAIYFALRFVGI